MPELDVSGNIVDMQDELDLADLDQDITNALATITAGLVELEDAQWNPKTTVQKAEVLRQSMDFTLSTLRRLLKAWRYVIRKLPV
ncbi:MAG: hypothetical protein ACXAEN_22495 [Candidatus Thorarchaeota archaeon]|jgi:hypothetical protein